MRPRWLVLALIGAVVLGPFAIADRGLSPLDAAERERLVAVGEAQRFVATSSGATHLRLFGPRDGEPILLIHGFSGTGRGWNRYGPAFADAGYHVLAPDLLGRGFSDRPAERHDAGLYDRQLVELLDALGIEGPLHVIGKSMGGGVATVFAANHPERVRTLALIAAIDIGDDNRPSRFLAAPLLGDWITAAFGRQIWIGRAEARAHRYEDPEAWLAAYHRQLDYPGFPRALLSSLRHFAPMDFGPSRTRVSEAGVPVLVVWGSADAVVPVSRVDAIRARIPAADVEIIEGASHAVEREHFPRVRDRLLAHVRRPAAIAERSTP